MEKERERIAKSLNDAIDKRINFDDEFEIPVNTEERKKFIEGGNNTIGHINTCSRYITEYIQDVFGWIPLNPNKRDVVEAISSVYVFTDKKVTDSNMFVNTEEGNRNFFIDITTDSDIDTFFLVGPKGSGKTFY